MQHLPTNLKSWHERLAHLNINTIRKLASSGAINGIHSGEYEKFSCDACQLGKAHRSSYKTNPEVREYEARDIFHGDVCGPMQAESLGGAKYFLLFKDEATDFRFIYFLRNKSDVYDYFREFDALVTNQRGKSMKVLRVDRGTEFLNENLRTYLRRKGIILEVSAPYTPQQNRKIERDNRTTMESARTMLAKKNVSMFLWAEAV